jgi:hypothetical protein
MVFNPILPVIITNFLVLLGKENPELIYLETRDMVKICPTYILGLDDLFLFRAVRSGNFWKCTD